ncbi:MAG: zinc ribbon domain-containing protein [Pirellulales bacterium]
MKRFDDDPPARPSGRRLPTDIAPADIVTAELAEPPRSAPPLLRGRPCDFCGGPLDPHDRFCPHCGGQQQSVPAAGPASESVPSTAQRPPTTVEPQAGPRPPLSPAAPELTPSQDVVSQQTSTAEVTDDGQVVSWDCRNCGSQFTTPRSQRSFQCPFCESNYVVELPEAVSHRRAPDFVIGFAIDAKQAYEQFRKWIGRNGWFQPGDLQSSQPADRFHGVYVPFWTFSMLAQSTWSVQVGEYWYRTETYQVRRPDGRYETHTRTVRETEWWPLRGKHHAYYNGYLVSASRGLDQAQADSVKPFNLPALRRFESYFLAGWLSEEYTIDHDQAFEKCQHVFLQREYNAVGDFLPGDTFQGLDVRTTFSHINGDLCLLPVYVMNYLYRGQPYRFVINGQTGKTAGDKPVSAPRVWAAAAAILLVIIVFMLLAFATQR